MVRFRRVLVATTLAGAGVLAVPAMALAQAAEEPGPTTTVAPATTTTTEAPATTTTTVTPETTTTTAPEGGVGMVRLPDEDAVVRPDLPDLQVTTTRPPAPPRPPRVAVVRATPRYTG